MAFKKSFIIPARAVTPMEDKLIRDSMAQTLVDLLKNDGKVITEDAAVVRDALPSQDFSMNGGPGTVDDHWVTGALVALTAAAEINAALANNKYCGFFKVVNLTASPVIDVLRFAVGSTGGATRGRFQLEALYGEEQQVGYFPDPVVYGPTEVIFAEVQPFAAAAGGELLILSSLIAEPKGPFVS